MMKNISKVLALIMAFAMLLTFAACGSSDSAENTSKVEDKSSSADIENSPAESAETNVSEISLDGVSVTLPQGYILKSNNEIRVFSCNADNTARIEISRNNMSFEEYKKIYGATAQEVLDKSLAADKNLTAVTAEDIQINGHNVIHFAIKNEKEYTSKYIIEQDDSFYTEVAASGSEQYIDELDAAMKTITIK